MVFDLHQGLFTSLEEGPVLQQLVTFLVQYL